MSSDSESLTERDAVHIRLYVFGKTREWLESQAKGEENSVSKFVTKLVKDAAREEGIVDA